jgi:flagellin
MAMNTHRQLGMTTTASSKSTEKLSSGFRINRAGDDAAGLSISEKMRGQIRGLSQASRNSQDGISLIQTAEGALTETHAILQRMRELAVQAANDTNVGDDRTEIQNELDQLIEEIDRIGNNTEFNTQKLLDGGSAQAAAPTTPVEPTEPGEGTPAQAAVLTGAVVATTVLEENFTTNPLADLTLNGQVVALTYVNGLDGSTTAIEIDDLAAELQKDINAVYDGTAHEELTFTVSVSDGALVITSSTTGEDATVAITANAASEALGLTENATTDASVSGVNAVEAEEPPAGETPAPSGEGFKATFQVGANHKQNFEILIGDMRAEALGLKGASPTTPVEPTEPGEGTPAQAAVLTGAVVATTVLEENFTTNPLADLTLNGQVVALTYVNGLDGSTTAIEIDDLAAELQKDINAVYDGTAHEELTFTVSVSDGALVITSSTTGEDATVAITANAASEALGLTENATTDASVSGVNAVEAEEPPAGETPAAGGGVIDVSSHELASKSIETIDNAIKQVSAQRSKLGAWQNRLEHTIKNLDTSSENLQAAESRIRDVDMAKEMMEFTKNNILQQAAQAMLAQANQQPQGVLQLLR